MPEGSRGMASGSGVVTIGVVLLLASFVHTLFFHLPAMRGQADPTLLAFEVAELVFLTLPPIGLVYTGFRIADGADDADAPGTLTIVAWCLLGVVAIPAIIGAIKLHQFLSASSIDTTAAQLELLTGAGGGGVLGLLIGLNNARARRQTERVREQRDSFVFLNRALRHHVLNSLNVVIGYAEKGRDRLPEGERDVLEPAIRRSESVVDLVEDVGRIAETYTGEQPGTPVEIVSAVAEGTESARLAYPYAQFDVTFPEEEVYVRGNGSLRVAFENVLSNAVEHNDRQTPTVSITVETDSDPVTIRVADDGPGIPAGKRNLVVTPPKTGAGGFGLYLANEIVEYHRGTLTILSNEPRGTTVEMRFPRSTTEGNRTDRQ